MSESGIKCKRVTNESNLLSEACTFTLPSSQHCVADGYAADEDIIYGNAKEIGSELTVGDAFDCKVSTTGDYTERFYYISPYYITNSPSSPIDNTTAVLIYYSNTINGVASTDGGAYNSTYNINWKGPLTAEPHLPTTTQWDNMELKTSSRIIWACDSNCNSIATETNNGRQSITPNPYTYTNRAARLLTFMELKQSGCAALSLNNPSALYSTAGSLKACNFLLERTNYSSSSNETYGVYFESPSSGNTSDVMMMSASGRNVQPGMAHSTVYKYGIRPAIDVPVSQILK